MAGGRKNFGEPEFPDLDLPVGGALLDEVLDLERGGLGSLENCPFDRRSKVGGIQESADIGWLGVELPGHLVERF